TGKSGRPHEPRAARSEDPRAGRSLCRATAGNLAGRRDRHHPVVVENGPGGRRVRLLAVAVEDFAHVDTEIDAGARAGAFAAAVRDGVVRAAPWLARQPASVFEELRSAGRGTEVFVGGWVTDDQFDLDVRPEFLWATPLPAPR